MKKEDLIGTWKFAGFSALSPDRKDPGPTDGRLIYTADGHMSAGVLRDGKFWGYCARYELDGDMITHHMIIGQREYRRRQYAAPPGEAGRQPPDPVGDPERQADRGADLGTRGVTRNDLIGSWKLVGYGPSGPPPAARVAPANEGLLIYSNDGHVSVSMARADGYWGYCGRFDVEGDTVIHRVAMGMKPAVPGTDQRRLATIEGNRLTLAVREPGTSVELVWERIGR